MLQLEQIILKLRQQMSLLELKEESLVRMFLPLKPRLHGDKNGKTHRSNANAIAKNLPSPRNIHRIVSNSTRRLRLHPNAGKATVHMPNLYVAL